MNPDVLYWDRGIEAVPVMTGASTVMDASDLIYVFDKLGLELPLRDVLDVGCGTGRLAKLCDRYVGVDVAPSAVAYCLRSGLTAYRISGPEEVPAYRRFETVACLSVFTHIARSERQRYLAAFAERGERLLVDVIHGKEGGDVSLWRADPDGFLADLDSAGFDVVASAQGIGTGAAHTYYSARLR